MQPLYNIVTGSDKGLENIVKQGKGWRLAKAMRVGGGGILHKSQGKFLWDDGI